MEGLTDSEQLQLRMLHAKARIRRIIGGSWQQSYFKLFPEDNTYDRGQKVADIWWCRKMDEGIVENFEHLAEQLEQEQVAVQEGGEA